MSALSRYPTLVALLLALHSPASAAEPQADAAPSAPAVPGAPAEPSAPATAPIDEWIKPEDVTDRADAVVRHVEARMPGASTTSEIEKIEAGLHKLEPELEARFEQAGRALAGPSSLITIQDARRELEGSSAPLEEWKGKVANEARRIADVLDEIAQAERRWTNTRIRAETAQAGEAVIKRVDSSLLFLAKSTAHLKGWRVRLLALSDRLLERSTAVDDMMNRLVGATVAEGEGILVPDHQPLWRRDLGRRLAQEWPEVPARIAEFQRSTREYFAEDARPFVLQLVFAIVLMLLLRNMPVHAQRRALPSQVAPRTMRVLDRPYAIAILLALVASPAIHPSAPHRVTQLLGLLAFVPVARILSIANERTNVALYVALAALLLVDRVSIALSSLPATSLVLFFLQIGFAAVIGLEYRRRLVAAGGSALVVRLMTLGLSLLAMAALAEIGGWSSLAALIGRGVIASSITALLVYAATISLEAVIAHSLASPALRTSRFIDRNQGMVQRWSAIVIRVAGGVFWMRIMLNSLGLRSIAGDGLRLLMSAGISVGALSLSVGGVLAFLFTLVMAMVISRLIHEILEDEVFPRTNLPRGIPNALLTLTRYAIFSLGFLLALAAAGVQVGQLAILMGGLGVGIGLGLQDVVKNFAAGITLLLERRVHVGDAVQIADKEIFGRVLSVGMRASVIRNWNGTEVIIPNDDMVSGTVTNWTLSDRLHRIEVKVGIAYGTDPQTVIDLLLGVVRSHKNLLATPPPTAFFTGFGESSLDFVLRAWTDQEYEANAEQTSELGVAVHSALRDAGIAIPFPQRDVHLTHITPQASAALRGTDDPA